MKTNYLDSVFAHGSLGLSVTNLTLVFDSLVKEDNDHLVPLYL